MKKLLLSLTLVSATSLAFSALAGDAKPLTVEQSIEINAKADAVWAKVNNFGDLGAWHPAVKSTEIVSGENNKKGAVRLLTLQDGGTIKEQLKKYDAKKHSFTYTILEGVLPVSAYRSTVTVDAVSDSVSKVTWSGSFKRKDTSSTPAQGQGDKDAVDTIKAVYEAGLNNLKKISE